MSSTKSMPKPTRAGSLLRYDSGDPPGGKSLWKWSYHRRSGLMANIPHDLKRGDVVSGRLAKCLVRGGREHATTPAGLRVLWGVEFAG